LYKQGYAVVRVAGSGAIDMPCPDIVALKSGRCYAVECKAWAKRNLCIPAEKVEELLAWAKRAGARPVIAWRYPRQGWFIMEPKEMHRSDKYYCINLEQAQVLKQKRTLLAGLG
jgi:Holliday junction resolvase